MDNSYLEQLINEAESRGGGMLLNFNDKPAAVVLTVEKYNQLLNSPNLTASVTPAAEKTLWDKSRGRHVLVTGGAGYIGAHLVRQLLKAGYKVTVIDNLSSGRREHVPPEVNFIEGDLGDYNLLRDLLAANNFEAVFHMAASIEVEESVQNPQKYFENNVMNTAKLLGAMNEAGVKKIIFSSTAAVYGQQEQMPIPENAKLKPDNPYGTSKALGEKIIRYYCEYADFNAIIFRYFNACGCDYDGEIQPTHESHLIPLVLNVASGASPQVLVYGNDYGTFDGTGIRDYVHVLDIAKAHVLALDKMGEGKNFRVYNIGTGKGLSVLQIINGASEILNKIIPMEIGPRRPGDAAVTIADNSRLVSDFGFTPEHSDLETIITTSWKQIAQRDKVNV